MRLLHACPQSCKRLRVDDTDSGPALERHRALEIVDDMVAKGMRRGDALDAIGLAKSTYYDWRRARLGGGIKGLVPKSTAPHRARGAGGPTATAGG